MGMDWRLPQRGDQLTGRNERFVLLDRLSDEHKNVRALIRIPSVLAAQ